MKRMFVALWLTAGLGMAAAQTESVQQGALAPAPAKTRPNGKQAVAKSGLEQGAPPAHDGHCVGVLSRLGVNFTLNKVDLIPLANEERTIPIEQWHVDDLIAARVGEYLGKRAVVRLVPWSREAYGPLERSRLTPTIFRDNEAVFADVARTLAAGMHCARYVTVTRHGESLGGGPILRGIGIADLLGIATVIYVHAQVRVHDGETFALLSRKELALAPPTLASLLVNDNHAPRRTVDKSWWPPPEQVVQDVRLRDAVRDLVARGLDATLPEMKLTE
jgi:hypothetical protein